MLSHIFGILFKLPIAMKVIVEYSFQRTLFARTNMVGINAFVEFNDRFIKFTRIKRKYIDWFPFNHFPLLISQQLHPQSDIISQTNCSLHIPLKSDSILANANNYIAIGPVLKVNGSISMQRISILFKTIEDKEVFIAALSKLILD
jgi:hypothetical protein